MIDEFKDKYLNEKSNYKRFFMIHIIVEKFEKNEKEFFLNINELIKWFIENVTHVDELEILLAITKRFKNNEVISNNRKKLLVIYDVNTTINQYSKEKNKDFIKSLLLLYNKADKWYDKSIEHCLCRMKLLMNHFNSVESHLSELKTFLVILKPHKNNPIIKDTLDQFYKTYLKVKERENKSIWIKQ